MRLHDVVLGLVMFLHKFRTGQRRARQELNLYVDTILDHTGRGQSARRWETLFFQAFELLEL